VRSRPALDLLDAGAGRSSSRRARKYSFQKAVIPIPLTRD
jgi:hypothetical protein